MDKMSDTVIYGIAAGCVLLIVAVCVVMYFVSSKRKTKTQKDIEDANGSPADTQTSREIIIDEVQEEKHVKWSDTDSDTIQSVEVESISEPPVDNTGSVRKHDSVVSDIKEYYSQTEENSSHP